MRKSVNISLIIGLVVYLTSCVSFKPGWNSNYNPSTDVNEVSLTSIAALESTANSGDKIIQLIDEYKKLSQQEKYHYYGLWKAGNYHILMGAAFCESKSEKKYHYKEAIRLCEKAMATNAQFIISINEGNDITTAAKNLTLNEIDAMGYWYTARFYYFKECLKPMGRVLNTKIVIDNNKMIEQIDLLDPNWAGGGNFFSRGLYYIAVPERFGGSKTIAEEEFNRAVEIGPDYIVNRWGRAKYLYHLTGNTEGFKKDLIWVISQDPKKSGNTFPWNVYFQNDARKMLSEISNSQSNTKQ